MTDLGSVSFAPVSKAKKPEEADFPQNGSILKHRKTKPLPRQPSTIVEAPEPNMADSGIYDETGNQIKGSSEDVSQVKESGSNQEKEDREVRPRLVRNGSIGKSSSVEEINKVQTEPDTNFRHSTGSEQEFGSGDILTDNDSLETVDKIGYHNIVAEVTVHEAGDHTGNGISKNSSAVKGNGHSKNSSKVKCHEQSSGNINQTQRKMDKDKCESDNLCNNDVKGKIASESSKKTENGDGVVNVDANGLNRDKERNSDKVDVVDVDDIDINENVDTEKAHGLQENISAKTEDNVAQKSVTETNDNEIKVDKQSEVENRLEEEILRHGANKIDENKNQTKGSVRFNEKDDGEIKEEHIVPTQAVLVEGTPPPKKDAGMKRESWASKKIRKTFKLRDKAEDEDQVDGKGRVGF